LQHIHVISLSLNSLLTRPPQTIGAGTLLVIRIRRASGDRVTDAAGDSNDAALSMPSAVPAYTGRQVTPIASKSDANLFGSKRNPFATRGYSTG
jgi:hypothetical protein